MWKFCGKTQFRAIRPKLCGNWAFPQNLHIRKLAAFTVFYTVQQKIILLRSKVTLELALFYKQGQKATPKHKIRVTGKQKKLCTRTISERNAVVFLSQRY